MRRLQDSTHSCLVTINQRGNYSPIYPLSFSLAFPRNSSLLSTILPCSGLIFAAPLTGWIHRHHPSGSSLSSPAPHPLEHALPNTSKVSVNCYFWTQLYCRLGSRGCEEEISACARWNISRECNPNGRFSKTRNRKCSMNSSGLTGFGIRVGPPVTTCGWCSFWEYWSLCRRKCSPR
jgi:hypothetical protein